MFFLRRFLTLFTLTLTLLSGTAFADTPVIPSIECGDTGVLIGCDTYNGEVPTPSNSRFGDLIGSVISTTISLFALLALIFVVKGGITLITSLGNDEKMKKARNTILFALLGLFVSTLAYLIVSIVTEIKLF